MKKYLSDLSKAFIVDLSLLRFAHLDWLNSTKEDQEEFIQIRKWLVKKMGGCFLEGFDALKMQSSGTTNGAKKTYYWGPSWRSHHDFFEWLKFEPYKFDLILYINPVASVESIRIMPMPVVDNVSFLVSINSNKIADMARVVKKHVGNKKVIFWLMPSYAKLLVDRGFDFSLFPPDSNYIYATGEPSPVEIRNHFTNMGYHYIDAMRSWMGGATFITCQYGKTHWIKMLADVSRGVDNELVTTDLFNLAQPFMNFETTDHIKWIDGEKCQCGLEDNQIEFINRDIVLPIKDRSVPFSELFSSLNTSLILRYNLKNVSPLLFCSFGYHSNSNSLFVLYEIGKNMPKIDKQCLEIFAKNLNINVKTIYAVNNYRTNGFKVTKMFKVSDQEANDFIRSNVIKVETKLNILSS